MGAWARRLADPLALGADVEELALEHVPLALAGGLALPDLLDGGGEDVGYLGAPFVVSTTRHHVPVPLDDELVVGRRAIGVPLGPRRVDLRPPQLSGR